MDCFKMDCYGGFARVYDALMTDAPYEQWAAYIDSILREKAGKPVSNTADMNSERPIRHEAGRNSLCNEKITEIPQIVVDLACGTGSITLRLAAMGYDMIGVDASEDMLAEAQRKAYEQNASILFLAQDMRELNLFGTVDAAVSVCDGLNYILSEGELLSVFKRVRLFLNPSGVFIFDMNTEYKFKEVLQNRVFEGKGADGEAYEWENHYNPETKINEYHVVFHGEDDEPFSELHRQRAYSPEDVCGLLTQAGFTEVVIRGDYTNDPPRPDSMRVVFVAS